MAVEPKHHAVSIVVRGSFAASMFQPAWFASKSLIPETESSTAKIEVVLPKVSIFSTDWASINVTENQLQVSTTQAPYFDSIRDLVSGIFKVVQETPFRAVGLNHSFHFPLENEVSWHAVGHALAPKEHWSGPLKDPGLKALVVQGARVDGREGYVQVNVEPSSVVRFGLFIAVNDHFQFAKDDAESLTDTEAIRTLLAESWDSSQQQAVAIANSLLKVANQ